MQYDLLMFMHLVNGGKYQNAMSAVMLAIPQTTIVADAVRKQRAKQFCAAALGLAGSIRTCDMTACIAALAIGAIIGFPIHAVLSRSTATRCQTQARSRHGLL